MPFRERYENAGSLGVRQMCSHLACRLGAPPVAYWPARVILDKSPNHPASPARRLVIEATFAASAWASPAANRIV